MGKIKDLNIEDLTKSAKKKKIKKIISRSFVGVLSSLIIISLIPNIEYRIALSKAYHDKTIETIMSSSELEQKDKAKKVFEYAINKNNNISADTKKKNIDAFSQNIIDHFGNEFTDKTIYNMYAVASTEKIREEYSFAQEHGWWTGDYNPYFNVYTYKEEEPSLLAHEQLHAILKHGLFGTGFTTGIEGYGLNEGAVTYFGADDHGYEYLIQFMNTLGVCIGYENTFKYFVNSDLEGLKNELKLYISDEKVNRFINNMNKIVFKDYYLIFVYRNNLKNDIEYFENFEDYILEKLVENNEILKEVYKNKYNCNLEDTSKGLLLKDACYVSECDDVSPGWRDVFTSYLGEGKVEIEIVSDSFEKYYFDSDIDATTIDDFEVVQKMVDNSINKKLSELLGFKVDSHGNFYIFSNDGKYSVHPICLKITMDESELDTKYIEILEKLHIDDKSLEKHNSKSL